MLTKPSINSQAVWPEEMERRIVMQMPSVRQHTWPKLCHWKNKYAEFYKIDELVIKFAG